MMCFQTLILLFSIINVTKPIPLFVKKNVSIQAYVTSLKMKQFKKERGNLKKLILKEPKNIHLRYIRLVIQESISKFLNYNIKIEEHKKFLKQMLAVKDSTYYLDFYILKHTTL